MACRSVMRVSRTLQHGRECGGILYDKTMPVEPKTLMMYYKRLREIDVPEMMASIIAETAISRGLIIAI